MSQRTFNVRVTSQVDKSLIDLLSKLDKYTSKVQEIKVRAVVDDKAFTAFSNSLEKVAKAKYTSSVDAKANSSSVDKLQNQLVTVSKDRSLLVTAKGDAKGLDIIDAEFKVLDKKADDLSNKKVAPEGDTSRLHKLGDYLDSLSSKVLGLTKDFAIDFGSNIVKNTKGLYDAQTSFVTQMENLETPRSQEWIKNTLSDIQDYGSKSKYEIEELVNLTASLEGAGVEDSWGLTKTLAGVTALAPNANVALKSVSRQIKQMSKEGKVYTKDWNSIREAIGGAATQKVLKEFANRGIDNLSEALSNGEIQGQLFMDVMRVVGDDPALQKMATQANTLTSAWDNLTETFYSNLVGTPFEKGALSPIYDGLVKLMNTLQDNVPKISEYIGELLSKGKDIFTDIFGEFNITDNIKGLKTTLAPLVGGLGLLGKVLAIVNGNGKNTGAIIGSIITASAGYMVVRKFAQALNFMSGIKLGNLFGGKSKGGTGSKGAIGGLNFQGLINSFSGAVNILSIAGSIKIISSAMKDIDSIDMSWGELGNKLLMMATTLGVTMVAMKSIGTALQKTKGLAKSMLIGAVVLTGVSLGILAMAKILEQLNGIEFDGNSVTKTLGDMAKILTVFGVISLIIGGISYGTGHASSGAIAIGIATILSLAGSMVLLTEAMKLVSKNVEEINTIKLPDVNTFSGKMANLLGLIGVISGTTTVGGILSAVSGVSSFFGAIGNLATAWYIDSLYDLVKKVDELIKLSNDIPSESDITGAISKISSLLESIRGKDGLLKAGESKGADFLEFWDSISDTFVNIAQGWEVESLFNSIMTVVQGIEKLQNANIPQDLSGIDTQLTAIKNLMDKLTTYTVEFNNNTETGTVTYSSSGSLGGAISAFFQKLEIDSIIPAMEKVINFVASLNNMPSIDASMIADVETKLEYLNQLIVKLKDAFNTTDDGLLDFGFIENLVESIGSFFQNKDIQSIIGGFNSLIEFTKSIISLEINDDIVKQIEDKLEHISTVLNKLNTIDIPTIQSIDKSKLEAIESFSSLTSSIKKIIEDVLAIKTDNIDNQILAIENALTKLKTLKDHEIFKDNSISESLNKNVALVGSLVEAISTVAGHLQTLQNTPVIEDLTSRINSINNALNLIKNGDGNGTVLIATINSFNDGVDYTKASDSVKSLVESLKSIAESLVSLPPIEDTDITKKITSITSCLTKITEKDGIQSQIKKLSGDKVSFENVYQMMDDLKNLAIKLSELPVLEETGADGTATNKVTKLITGISNALDSLTSQDGNSLVSKINILSGMSESFSSAKTSIDNLKEVATSITKIPTITDEIVGNITKLRACISELATIVISPDTLNNVGTLLTKLGEVGTKSTELTTKLSNDGTTSGKNFVSNFLTELGSKISDAVSKERDKVAGQDWKSTGANLAKAFTDGFDVSDVITKINSIQTALNGLQSKTIDISVNKTTYEQTVRRSNGGIIPEYHSTGGIIGRGWKQSGTDTVPAMLTAGEYVLKRSVTSALGNQFLNALNSMNLTQALKHLANITGNQVIHNTTNNITQNVDNKASFLNGITELKGVIRP